MEGRRGEEERGELGEGEMSNRQQRRESSSTFFGGLPSLHFPSRPFLSSRPLRRSLLFLLFPTPFGPTVFPQSSRNLLFSTDRVVRAFHSFLATPSSSFIASRRIKRREDKERGTGLGRKRKVKVPEGEVAGSSATLAVLSSRISGPENETASTTRSR